MINHTMQTWLRSSYLTKSNQFYIEELYKSFLKDPKSVDINWSIIFNNLSNEKYFSLEFFKEQKIISQHLQSSESYLITQQKIFQLIEAFRLHGHKYAKLDPLGIWKRNFPECLNLNFYEFTKHDLQKELSLSSFDISDKTIKLVNLHKMLKKIYCGSFGIEYMHLDDKKQIKWIQKNIESSMGEMNFSISKKKQLLNEIIQSENIEQYLHVIFPGTKRFSLEGADVLIPMLKEIIRYSSKNEIKKIILSMAHRGRLNVLINILNKLPRDLFKEFSNKNKLENLYSGDVKYHQGFSSHIKIKDTYIDILLLSNPSHLEIINPVAMGVARAYIDKSNILNSTNTVLPITIHGDAAISGQGIVQETLNMSQVPAYNVDGSIRIVINNQIGFTTSKIEHMRSSKYCTDIGKMLQIPIFHVNADDPEKVIFVTHLALNFRKIFKRDVLIDLVCYRRHGHNEVDEPKVTQPLMYQKIHQHPSLCKIYSDYLKISGVVVDKNISEMINIFKNFLNQEKILFEKNLKNTQSNTVISQTTILHYNQKLNFKKIQYEYLKKLAYSINSLPKDFNIHTRVNKIYQSRIEMAKENKPFDWGGAEILAYATLLDTGVSIRLSGEDTARGTFFHRHAIIYDQNNGTSYIPLSNFNKNQGSFFIWDSVLSEEAALAFEYGYSIYSYPNTLVIWEAQFGDFSNGAQIVIDQFISSGEQKWGQTSNLVMLLPHGYEGQGPEHSSARIERYLQLCAENNMRICIPSTPSQIYHLLRHQVLNEIPKPLIIVTPKSLLRHSMVKTSFHELINGSFQTIIAEKNKDINPKSISKVLICSGKIYYDLIEYRQNKQQYDTAIIRIEQLYPFPMKEICEVFEVYKHVKHFVWCQEEPKNQGIWHYGKNYFYKIIPPNAVLRYVGRPDCAAPATGYFSLHQKQQNALLDNALNVN